jgi:hypothetical protein
MIKHFHSKMVDQGKILEKGDISADQREFISRSRMILDIELQKSEISELRLVWQIHFVLVLNDTP